MRAQADGSLSSAPSRNGNVAASGHSTGSGPSSDDGRERRAVAAAKRGDWDAIHYLYVRYADDVFGYVQSIVRDHHEAEDITQNVFAKLITAIERYEERAVPFAAWIMRVARNAALDHLRARRQIPVEEVRASDPGDERLETAGRPESHVGAGPPTRRHLRWVPI
jgi:DNA-directed RNA polymerase specialized sigma24 family protein